jgi:hypothetical protein
VYFVEIGWDGVDSIDEAQRRDKRYAVFKKENKPPGFKKRKLFLL